MFRNFWKWFFIEATSTQKKEYSIKYSMHYLNLIVEARMNVYNLVKNSLIVYKY